MRYLLIIPLFFGFASYSQEASLVLENNEIRIGEPTVLHLQFQYQNPHGEALVGWPQYDDKLTKDIEILDRTMDFETLTDSANHIYTREQNLSITAWEEGFYLIPTQAIELNDSLYYTQTEMLMVQTVQVDTTQGITDIKENYEIQYTMSERVGDWFSDNWGWFVAIAALALIFFLFRMYKNRTKKEEEVYVPQIPAHITALKNLKILMKAEAWKTEDHKQYYSNLTDTVRLYLEQRFGIYAMEKTTREIIQDLKFSDISEGDKNFLKSILNQADMVKFAKFKPVEEDGLVCLNKSIDFVERTKQEEEETEEKEDDGQS